MPGMCCNNSDLCVHAHLIIYLCAKNSLTNSVGPLRTFNADFRTSGLPEVNFGSAGPDLNEGKIEPGIRNPDPIKF